MIGSGMGGRLSGGGLRRRRDEEDLDPSSGLVNLADCMLVLAAGLMTALVIAWNIDITSTTTEVDIEDSQVVENVEDTDEFLGSGGDTYIDMGRVYQDPETGQLYLVTPSTEETTSEGE